MNLEKTINLIVNLSDEPFTKIMKFPNTDIDIPVTGGVWGFRLLGRSVVMGGGGFDMNCCFFVQCQGRKKPCPGRPLFKTIFGRPLTVSRL